MDCKNSPKFYSFKKRSTDVDMVMVVFCAVKILKAAINFL